MALFVWPPQSINTTGLATATKQDDMINLLGAIDGHVDGLETLVTSTNGKLDTLNSKDFALEATQQKLRKWPYATHAKIVPTEDGTNEYYTYKTTGDVTVGTITINKTTGVITYSPDKVV